MNIDYHAPNSYPYILKELIRFTRTVNFSIAYGQRAWAGWGRGIMDVDLPLGHKNEAEELRPLGARLRSGDRNALDSLYSEHQNRLHSLARAFGFSAIDAEDLVQETFLRVWRFREQAPLEIGKRSSWLTSILANACNAVHQKNSRWANFRSMLGFLKTAQAKSTSKNPSPEAMLQDQELWEQVTTAIQTLDPLDRMVIVLAKLEGMKSQEIAETLSLEPGTVRVKLFRAMQHIRSTLEDKDQW